MRPVPESFNSCANASFVSRAWRGTFVDLTRSWFASFRFSILSLLSLLSLLIPFPQLTRDAGWEALSPARTSEIGPSTRST